MKFNFVRESLAVVILFFVSSIVTAAPTWKIIPSESSLTFAAIQNDAPVLGSFKKFTGNIQFDPADLKSSHVEIHIDVASVRTDDSQVADALITADWFDANAFPEAVFKARNFVKTGDKTYDAKGILTIRDKSVPVVLVFKLDEYSLRKALVTGSVTLKRTQFGIGQGEWARTDEVKENVKVEFIISATRNK